MAIDLSLMGELVRRAATELADIRYLRPLLRDIIAKNERVLEIGAGDAPLFQKGSHENYKVLDYYSTEEIARHFEVDYGIERAKFANFAAVDFVCKDGALSRAVAGATFDVVYSSHAVEHQPCLVRHLQEIEKILAPDAVVVMIVPDKEHTFDALRQLSTTGDVLYAFHSGGEKPRGAEVFEFYARHININPDRKVLAHEAFAFSNSLFDAYDKFKQSIAADPAYFDIHNWAFTPNSFVLIVLELYLLGLTRLFPQIISGVNGNEFMCVMNVQNPPQAEELPALNEFRLQLCRELSFS
ncbi:methyltransferase domain-containing protein [Rhodocyclus tenuis]|uniref:methyltransferase domain-containing protein n=1 Tax=Rhodocyclus gracilis TaxID=2929842 RepID=UPI001298AAA3|nr:methyltransferase domain-containing protein [Rhodocyclus gracilis]